MNYYDIDMSIQIAIYMIYILVLLLLYYKDRDRHTYPFQWAAGNFLFNVYIYVCVCAQCSYLYGFSAKYFLLNNFCSIAFMYSIFEWYKLRFNKPYEKRLEAIPNSTGDYKETIRSKGRLCAMLSTKHMLINDESISNKTKCGNSTIFEFPFGISVQLISSFFDFFFSSICLAIFNLRNSIHFGILVFFSIPNRALWALRKSMEDMYTHTHTHTRIHILT